MLGAGVPTVVLPPPMEPADGGPLLFVGYLAVVVFVGAVVASWIRSKERADRSDDERAELRLDRAA